MPTQLDEKGKEKRRRGGAVRAGTCGGGTVIGAKLFAKVTTLAKRLAHDDCRSEHPGGCYILGAHPGQLRAIIALAVALFGYSARAAGIIAPL